MPWPRAQCWQPGFKPKISQHANRYHLLLAILTVLILPVLQCQTFSFDVLQSAILRVFLIKLWHFILDKTTLWLTDQHVSSNSAKLFLFDIVPACPRAILLISLGDLYCCNYERYTTSHVEDRRTRD